MLEELGFTEEELDKLGKALLKLSEESLKDGQIMKTDEEMFLLFAKLPISTSKIKSAVSKIRVKAVTFAANILTELLLTNLPKENEQFIQQLHNGDDAAFLKILQFIKAEFFNFIPQNSNKERRDISVEQISKFFNSEIKQYICLAAACILSGVPSAANANIEMAFIKLFQLFKIYEATDKVLHIEGELKRASDVSKRANNKRHTKNHMIRIFAIELYEERNFPSVKNASQQIAEQVMNYAHNDKELNDMEGTNKRFTSPFQAAETIERWLGAFKKEQKAKV